MASVALACQYWILRVLRWHFTLMLLIFYDCVVADSLLRHRVSPSFIHFCFVLPCSIFPFSSSTSFLSLLLPVLATCTRGLFCVFSCACPSPFRSKYWGAHPDPSRGETPEDQSSPPVGGRQRYAADPKTPFLARAPDASLLAFSSFRSHLRENPTDFRSLIGSEWTLVSPVKLQTCPSVPVLRFPKHRCSAGLGVVPWWLPLACV